jgi:exonuclease VII large subunit
MSDETQAQEPAATGSENTEALQRSVEALERKNQELIAELRQAKKSKAPDGVNVEELLEFKRNYEQQQLESQGKYQEARQALEQQFREATAEKDQRIADLEARVRELELITPAVTALADIVHDPDLVLKTKLSADKIEREADGTVVVVDGYQRTPVNEWAKTLPSWMQKQPKPQGSGAPSGSASTGGIPPGTVNPFNKETFNLTEQARLFRTDKDLYDRLKATANR